MSSKKRQCIVILGMHRSGTSALTGVLQLLGVDLGKNLLEPLEDNNPRGFFENRKIHHINEAILKSVDSSWDALFPLPESWWQQEHLSGYKQEIFEILKSEFSSSNLFGIKDPRMCLLLPFWQQIFRELDITTSYVIIVRNPLEIAASLTQRDCFSFEKSGILWMNYMLYAESYSRNYPRVFVFFDDLLDNPQKTIDFIASGLSLSFPHNVQDIKEALNEFLTPDLKHHNIEDNAVNTQLLSFMTKYYQILQNLLNTSKIPGKEITNINKVRKDFYRMSDWFYNADIRHTVNMLKEKEALLNEQEQTIQQRDQILQQQKRQNYRQARIIRQQQQRIQAIESTLSWKITEPLRKADRFLSIRDLPLSKSLLLVTKNLMKTNHSLNLFGEKPFLFPGEKKCKEIKVPKIELIDLSASERIPVEEITISVIIPVLNGAKYLRLLLPALKKQKGIKNIEIIVVDSGSTDSSMEICRNFETKIITITPEEFSHSSARNIGAENAHGQYLLFLTQDALPTTDTWLYEMLNVLKKNDVAAVSCKEYPRSDADLFTRVQMWRHYNWLGMANQDKILSKPASSDYHSLRKHSQLDDVACLMKETVFSKYRFRGEYAEDIDLGLRLVHDGYKIASVDSVSIIHSHTRSCYYYLQRGYIDSFSMSKLFVDFPPPESDIAFNDFCDDIILTYFNLNNAIDCLKDSHKIDITTFFEKFLYKYNNSKNFARIKQPVNFYENNYLDKEFKRFLSFIEQYANLDKFLKTRNVHSCLLLFICDTKKYMVNIYESFNNNMLEDFNASMYKSLAFHIGVIFSNSYTRKPDNPEMSKLYDKFFDKNVQKVRV